MDSKLVIISPYSRPLRNGKQNPKDYPYWDGLIKKLHDHNYTVLQVGVKEEKQLIDNCKMNLPLSELRKLLDSCYFWISVDNFFPHFASYYGKPGVVIFGKSDPDIFGHDENYNILKNKNFLRKRQFDVWEAENYDIHVFPTVDEVFHVCQQSFLT